MGNLDDPLRSEPDALLGALRATLEQWAVTAVPTRLTVALSGGLDSTVLLAALVRLRLPTPLRAAHVNHALHPESGRWSEHCAALAAQLGVEFVTVTVAVDAVSGFGLEAAARDARYAALAGVLYPGEWLLTAHHADDQLETVLLRLLRGAGVRGLRGIIPFGPFRGGFLARPLLSFDRAELRSRAVAWGLTWIEDPSNREVRHDRNFLRARLLPQLLERWPAAVEHTRRLAEQMTEAEAILESVATADAEALADPSWVSKTALAALAPARQRNLLRYLLRRVGVGVPSARKLDELRRALLDSRAHSQPLIRWPGAEARVFREHLHLMAPLPAASAPDFEVALAAGASWSGPEGTVRLVPAHGEAGLPESWLGAGLTLKFRAGGERFKPFGRHHHVSLKHLFQENGVVPWLRSRVPLLYRGGLLVAVGDAWITAESAVAAAREPRWRVAWTAHPALTVPERK